MASVSANVITTSRSISASKAESNYFVVLASCVVVLNAFTFLYHFTAMTLFNALTNTLAVAAIAYSLVPILRPRRYDIASRRLLLVATCVIGLSVIVNLGNIGSMVEVLKYLSLYIFYAAGRSYGGRLSSAERKCIYALAILPLIFLVTGSSKVFAGEIFFSETIGYLPNANTAVLYYSALLFALAQENRNHVTILLQLINAALWNKIGAILATAVAIFLWIFFPLRRESMIALVVAGVGAAIGLLLGAFDRVVAAFDNIVLVFSLDPGRIHSMSWGQLVALTGSTELSSFFRLIHWSNMWTLYSEGGIGTLLFGYGPGQTMYLTYAGLMPHSDYLRMLVEYGPFNLVVFIVFLLHVRSSISPGAAKVLFTVLCFYFFSENLLDNFTSMALFFAYAGRFAASSARQHTDAEHSWRAALRMPGETRAHPRPRSS